MNVTNVCQREMDSVKASNIAPFRTSPIFPSAASLLRVVTVKAMDRSDEWEDISGKSYISPEKLQLAAEALQTTWSQSQNSAA